MVGLPEGSLEQQTTGIHQIKYVMQQAVCSCKQFSVSGLMREYKCLFWKMLFHNVTSQQISIHLNSDNDV